MHGGVTPASWSSNAGQEKHQPAGARHTACTVEMASLSQLVDVAVVDEIQMLGDASRCEALLLLALYYSYYCT